VDTSPTRPAASPPSARTAVLPAHAATWSALTIALGLWWLALPGAYPFVPGNPDPSGTAFEVVPAAAVPPALVAAGAWGLVVAGPARRGTALVVATGVAYALVFGLAVPGIQPVTLTGYLMAMFGPVVLFATVLAGAWRWRGGPAAVAVFVLVGAVAWVTGLANGEVLGRYAGGITASLAKMGAARRAPVPTGRRPALGASSPPGRCCAQGVPPRRGPGPSRPPAGDGSRR
jgi:hypothetical protein